MFYTHQPIGRRRYAASHVRYQVTRVLHSSANREEDGKEEMAASHVRYQVTRVLHSSANREWTVAYQTPNQFSCDISARYVRYEDLQG